MIFISKFRKFIGSDNKGSILCNKALMALQQITNTRKFGAYGRGSILRSPDRILGRKHIYIGNYVGILQHARIEAISKYKEQSYEPQIIIGDKTSIGQNLHVVACNEVKIGREVTISGNVFISDCSHEYRELDVNSSDQPLLIDKTKIGDYSFIGYGAAIMPGAILGKQCIVGTNAVVLKGVYPDCCVLAGVPAKIIKRYNPLTKEWESVNSK